MPKHNLPSWFNQTEYANFLIESGILFASPQEINWLTEKTFINNTPENTRDTMFKHKTNKLQDTFLQSLFEVAESKRTPLKAEKSRMRPEVDPSDRERDRKRESRRQDGQKNIMSQIIIVKNNNSNKVEIILATDFDKKIHTVVKGRVGKIDKGDVSRRDLSYYSSMENFINTKTSIKLLGKIGKEKEVKEKGGKKSPQEDSSAMPPPPPTPRTPKNGKEITDEFSTYPDWDHNTAQITAILPDALNTLSGQQPSIEYQQSIDSSRTLGDSINRIVKEIQKTFPEAAAMTFSLPEPLYNTGQLWNSMNMPQAPGNIDLIGVSENGFMGVSVKIGEQIRPGVKGEAALTFNAALSAVNPQNLIQTFGLTVKDFVEDLRQDFSKSLQQNSNFTTPQQGAMLLQKNKSQNDFIAGRQKSLVNKVGEIIEYYLNENSELKIAFLRESFTGNAKFEGQPGSAQVMLSANKDGTDSKIIPLNDEFINNFAESDDTNVSLKFKANMSQENQFLMGIMAKIGQVNESALDAVIDIEKMKDQLTTPQEFIQLFGLEITDAVFKKPLVYSDFYTGDSDISNTITINSGGADEQQINIPVKTDFDPYGDEEEIIQRGADSLMESYLLTNDYLVEQVNNGTINVSDASNLLTEQFNLFEKRNYRREYDNYQGKPEQRANRSKRVLARRKMIKKGKARKGDGKDINHKDGNPQNNSMSNLESMSASKNRAMHEDHGAGFEGTPELVDTLTNATPHSGRVAKTCDCCKTYSEIRNNKKKKKK